MASTLRGRASPGDIALLTGTGVRRLCPDIFMAALSGLERGRIWGQDPDVHEEF
jgi:hypothetical protein